jgi:hypothetical protein
LNPQEQCLLKEQSGVVKRNHHNKSVVSGKESTRTAMNYVEAVINMDIQRVDGIEKDPERVRVHYYNLWPEMLPL